ncbi:hypothetical protein DPMN_151790 [Dreissena polymorpha]|uniref:Uncharacterized protein n=1 Tax=Dreissena polymorpha TaxID=45954 RepID=A0A9D4FLV7_DREPO|nr:hypothetical protein DPMN_151790 [Dreissena polymorpha]
MHLEILTAATVSRSNTLQHDLHAFGDTYSSHCEQIKHLTSRPPCIWRYLQQPL